MYKTTKNITIMIVIAIITSSTYCFIASPKNIKIKLTIKNLNPLPKKLAIKNLIKFIFKIPLAMVKILYGIGVNAEKKTAKEPYLLYRFSTFKSSEARNFME